MWIVKYNGDYLGGDKIIIDNELNILHYIYNFRVYILDKHG